MYIFFYDHFCVTSELEAILVGNESKFLNNENINHWVLKMFQNIATGKIYYNV